MSRPSPHPKELIRPCPVLKGATHFCLRKGGRNGEPCELPIPGGVVQRHHPIDLFDAHEITKRWGFSPDYWVQFSRLDGKNKRIMIGGPKQTGLLDPREPGPRSGLARADGPDASPEVTATPMPLAMMGFEQQLDNVTKLRNLVSGDSAAAIEAAERRAHASIDLFKEMFREIIAIKKAPVEDDRLAELRDELREQREETKRLQERLMRRRDEPDEPTPSSDPGSETDEDRARRLVKAYKSGKGTKALMDFAGEETAMTLMRMLPMLRAKLPEIASQLGPIFRQALAALDQPIGAPPAQRPAEEIKIPKRRSEQRVQPPDPPPEDEFTARVV